MRLVQVAKALGMTGQELRKELTEVDFGVRPTDREIPESLAQGIIRVVARKYGKEIDMAALGFAPEGEAAVPERKDNESQPAPAPVVAVDQQADMSMGVTAANTGQQGPSVLRKLTLEGVSKEAIERQKKKMGTKPSKKRMKTLSSEKIVPRKRAEDAMQQQIKKKEGVVILPPELTVKEFAEKAGVQVPSVVQSLMKNGVMATINQTIDYDTAAIVAADLGVQVEKEHGTATAEDIFSRNLEELLKDEPERLMTRPPIVVVMGHVDHGKTSILDAIRSTDVVSTEAGGITQHIGAYQVVHEMAGEKHPITFLDTPGHEAFTAMRARGAQVTDIAIIVVSAEEGVKPTTIEAIDHAKDAGVPILVAINKIDRENANPDKVKGELAGQELQPEEWGGKTPMVLCSAKTKQGITDLLDHVMLLAQMAELKANPNRPAVATVIESHLDPSLGALATVVVNTGTLRAGDSFVCGATMGRVRAMTDARDKKLAEATPSSAVRISGFDVTAQVGDILQVVLDDHQARGLLDAVKERGELQKKRSFADLVSRLSEGKLAHLKIVLKADNQGSLEALQGAVRLKSTSEVTVKVIHAAIGAVSESDVMMAAASDGVVMAFHTPVPATVRRTAEREGVQVREYEVIYALLDDIEGLVQGLVEPEEEEKIAGHIEIRGLFLTEKNEQIVGGMVTDGVAKRLPFRLQRGGTLVGTGRITSLRKVEKDVKEVKEGSECGMRVESSTPVLEGDILEMFVKELKKK